MPAALAAVEVVLRQEQETMVRDSLDALPEIYRQVFRFRHERKLSHREMGVLLDVSEEAVRKLYQRVLAAIGNHLEARESIRRDRVA